MEFSEIVQVAAIGGFVITFLLLVANVIYRIGRLTQQVQDLKESQTRELQSFKESQTRELRSFKESQALELQSVRQDMHSLEQRINHNHEVLRADIQRLFEAMASHTHDTDGNIIFRVPPSASQADAEGLAD